MAQPPLLSRSVAGAAALVLVVAAAVAALVLPAPVRAAETNVPVSAVSEQRLDATVTKTTIVTAFATAHDSIDVYNYVPVQVSNDWRPATSMDNATWVFKSGGGAAKLAIFFTIEGGKHVARLYDDQLAEGAAPITVKNNHAVLSHPMHWTLQAETSQPWIQPDGRPATDLQIDGAFSLPHEDDGLRSLAHRWHGHDAWDFRMVDPSGSGVPQYTLMHLYPDVAQTAAVPRTQLVVNVAKVPVTAFAQAEFWPLLGSQDIGVRSWFDRRPPLSMNWQSGQLLDFGSIIPDLEPENGMQIFSQTPTLPNQLNDLNFENPFAYYRFDRGHTGLPNLIIRHFYYPAGDQYLQVGGTPQPVEFVRYSWGNGDGLIQYKLGLLGRHGANTTLTLNGFAVRTMDYASLPTWVVSRQWDFETFVASEIGGYRSSEGIYDWEYVPGDFSWAFGDAATLPLNAYRAITPGLRGEYRILPAAPPQLYVDAVDGRVHLLGAQYGLWSVDQHQAITTASFDGQTVGQWIRSVDKAPQEAFYALPQVHLYAGAGAVVMQPVKVAPAIVPIAPPSDAASLDNLRRLQPAAPPLLAQQGLRTLLDLQPAGDDQLTLSGVTLSHVRLVAGGWRAELQTGSEVALVAQAAVPPALLQAVASALGCPPEGQQARPQPCALPARRYVLRFDGTWHVQAASPPDLQIISLQAGTGRPKFAEMPVTITVANAGATDSSDQTLHVWAQRTGDQRVALTDLDVDLPANEQRQFSLQWLPSAPGHWTIGTTLGPRGNSPSAPAAAAGTMPPVMAEVVVPAAAWPAWWTLGPAPTASLIGGAFSVLLAVAILTAATVWVILR